MIKEEQNKKLPGLGSWILRRILPVRDSFYLFGDFKEIYFDTLEKKGAIRAWFWYWQQILKTIPKFLYTTLLLDAIMLKNHLKLFVRILNKNKAYSLINFSGLSIGLFAFILMFLYVDDEFKYDRFHSKGEDIYRLTRDLKYSENTAPFATAGSPIAPALSADYEGLVEDIVRFYRVGVMVSLPGDKGIQENGFIFSDASVFNVFDFPLQQGDAESALSEPFTVVLTQETAKKYFGDSNPVGKTLEYEGDHTFRVTGVFEKIPVNSHLKFDFLASFSSLKTLLQQDPDIVGETNLWTHLVYTYLHIPNKQNVSELEKVFPDVLEKFYGNWVNDDGGGITLGLQPIFDIHLRSKLEAEMYANSDIAYVYIISGVALMVLLVACFNFMNLSTSRSIKRAKEVGVRKVAGAFKNQLIQQFLFESVSFSIISLTAAVALVYAALPYFNEFSGKDLSLNIAGNINLVLGFAGMIIVTGILSGSYPAFFLSSFRPVKVLKSGSSMRTANGLLRRSLITVQFVIAVVLIIGTFIINDQMQFIKGKNLGINKDQVISIRMRDTKANQSFEVYKNEFLSSPDVVSVAQVSSLPFKDALSSINYATAEQTDANPTMKMVLVDHDFLTTMQIDLVQGRDFEETTMSDRSYGYILNEAAVRELGWNDPLGKDFGRPPGIYSFAGVTKLGKVVGVVKDFHFNSLHKRIEPLAMFMGPDIYSAFRYLVVRVHSQNINQTLEFLKMKWETLEPYRPFEFTFLDDSFQTLYASEEKLEKVFQYFSFLTIFVTCLGLVGLVSFTVEQRSKEIGIRKVLGASTPKVIDLIIREFVKLVIISNAIAWPIAFLASRAWLEQFAYRTDIAIASFVLAAVVAVILAISTISYQTLKAAYSNPVKALMQE